MSFHITWSLSWLFIVILAANYACAKVVQLSSRSHAPLQYAIVCDAGSTGTRIKVFQYIKGVHDPIEVSDIKQVSVQKPSKVKPGLAEFANNINGTKANLGPLMASAKKVIPVHQQASTPIYLFATGGMRLLRENKKNAVLNEVDRLFLDKSFCPFHYKNGSARIINGEEEAFYGWITVNFLKGVFSSAHIPYGALELGGASTQNSFKMANKKVLQPTFLLSVAGKKYPVYAHSFLGNGMTLATQSYLEYLVKNHVVNNIVVSPCHNIGYEKNIVVERRKYIMRGKYDRLSCQKYIRDRFFSINGPFSHQPKLVGEFYSFSAFYYIINDAGILKNDSDVVLLKQIELASQIICSKHANELDTNMYEVYGLCFRINYIFELLKDGYKVDEKSFTLHVAKDLEGFKINWSLGVMLLVTKTL